MTEDQRDPVTYDPAIYHNIDILCAVKAYLRSKNVSDIQPQAENPADDAVFSQPEQTALASYLIVHYDAALTREEVGFFIAYPVSFPEAFLADVDRSFSGDTSDEPLNETESVPAPKPEPDSQPEQDKAEDDSQSEGVEGESEDQKPEEDKAEAPAPAPEPAPVPEPAPAPAPTPEAEPEAKKSAKKSSAKKA